jgi:hypothetical protein
MKEVRCVGKDALFFNFLSKGSRKENFLSCKNINSFVFFITEKH